MAFQTSVNQQQAPGLPGGFSGNNPIFTLTNPDEGMWVAGPNGAVIGQFAWANPSNGQVTSNHPGAANARVGFVHRNQPAVIVGLAATSSLLVVAGQGIDLLEDGPMWAGPFAAGATVGQKVYASFADGSVSAAATATPATVTRSVTTTNGSTAISYTGGTLFAGQPISGAGIPAGAYIASVNSTAGTAVLSAAATASATVTGTATTNFETNWTTRSNAAAGELAKISVRG